MTLGEKLKNARKSKKITQAALADGIVTRNMLCAIEKGNANPSLDTIRALAARLELPSSYFLSEDDDLFFYQKANSISKIHAALKTKNYKSAIERAKALSGVDNEISYILAYCHFELAEASVKNGALDSAKAHLNEFYKNAEATVYDLSRQHALAGLYFAIAENIQAPLLEFNTSKYEAGVNDTVAYEYYKYLTLDFSYDFKEERFADHMRAKILIRERKYAEAVKLLIKIEEKKNPDYDAYLIFSVYTDLEGCYKQLYDFENAYRYSSKRLSLLESYKS